MFSKKVKPEETELFESESRAIPDLEPRFQPPTTPSKIGDLETNTQPEVVQIVEKISAIIAPYFIAVVGLYLYKENPVIGTILIAVGIISLFKLPVKDLLAKFLDLLGVNVT